MNLKKNNILRRFARFFAGKKKLCCYLTGAVAGFLGGIFGSGGGIVTALALRHLQKDWAEKDRLAATLCTVLPSVAVAAGLYALKGSYRLSVWLPMLPASALGGLLGAFFSRKVGGKWLRILFAAMLLLGGGLLLLR